MCMKHIYFNERKLAEIVDKVNELNPDLVVIPGDLFDNTIKKELI